MLLMISALASYGKCNWNDLYFSQANNGTTFTWYLNGARIKLDPQTNTCVGWRYIIYNVRSKTSDTLKPVKYYTGYTTHKFLQKGKYKIYVQVWDTCNKCDTTITRDVELQYFNSVKTYESKLACDRSSFEMSGAITKDSCYEYSYYVYTGKSYFNNSFLMTKSQWDTIKNETIWANYSDFAYFEMEASKLGKSFDYVFDNKNYRYFVVSKCHNRCNNQDTAYGMKVTTTCKKDTTLSLTILEEPEPTIIATYDILGRPVEKVEAGVPYIFLYDNGQRKKIIKTK